MQSLGIEAALESNAPRLYNRYSVVKEKLIDEVYVRWAQKFPEGNDHGPEHIKRVLEKLDQLVGRDPIGTTIRTYELYLAMMAILYHDIGILRSRKNHADEASDFLSKKISGTPYFLHDNESFLFDMHDRDVIRAAVVSHSSSKDIVEECGSLGEEYTIASNVVRPHFIAALVRLADELDEDYRRAPTIVEPLMEVPRGSLFYWRFCQRISGIRAERDRHRIVIDAQFQMEDIDYIMDVDGKKKPFISVFAEKLVKINNERSHTNKFFPSEVKYSELIVNLRPLEKHPEWTRPRLCAFSDGTQSNHFHNTFPELQQKVVPNHVPRFQIPGVDNHALNLMLAPEEDEIDRDHRYTKIKWEVTIDKELNYRGNYTFTGTNKSEGLSSDLIIPLTVVGAHTIEDLSPRAFDLQRNQTLPCTTLAYSNSRNKFRMKIQMNDSLNPGDSFNIQFSFCLPKVMYREADFDAIGLTRFSQGVEEFEYVFKTPYVIEEPHLYAVRQGRLETRLNDLGDMITENEPGIYTVKKTVKEGLKDSANVGLVFYYARLADPKATFQQ